MVLQYGIKLMHLTKYVKVYSYYNGLLMTLKAIRII